MKKVILFLLTFAMVFSLCACGGEATEETSGTPSQSTNETTEQSESQAEENNIEELPKEVTITTDNWQDYLELKEVATWKTNDFGELERLSYYVTVIALKEEFSGAVLSADTEIAFEYSATKNTYEVEGNTETFELTFGTDPVSTEEVTNTTSYKSLMEFKDAMPNIYTQLEEECIPVSLFKMTMSVGEANVYDNVIFSRIEGTLVFD